MKEDNNQYLFGKNPIYEAIKSGRDIHKIYIADGIQRKSIHELSLLIKEKGITTQFVPKKKLDQIAQNGNHQGLIAEIAAYDYVEFNDLLSTIQEKKSLPFLLMLDSIEDPHNLGSILRTADVVGVDGLIIPKRRSVGLTNVVAKTSVGAIEYVPVSRVTNLAQTIDTLKDAGYWIIGTDAFAEQSFIDVDYKMPVCLVIGSEGKGISRLIKDKCDFFVNMPMKGHVNSLNASVAAAIIMYEVYRQRGF